MTVLKLNRNTEKLKYEWNQWEKPEKTEKRNCVWASFENVGLKCFQLNNSCLFCGPDVI